MFYLDCQFTEWFDLDDPSSGQETESVGSIFKYLKGLDPKNIHRSCSMKNIHYPTDIQTIEGQNEVENSSYSILPHQLSCSNSMNTIKPGELILHYTFSHLI